MAPYATDSILRSQANLIRKLHVGEDQPFGGRAITLTVSLEAGAVMKGLINLGMAMSKNAMEAMLIRGEELLWDIREETPTGPPRDLPPGLDVESGRTASRTLSTPGDSFAQARYRALAEEALSALGHESHHGESLTSAADRHDLEEARALLREGGHGGPAIDFVWGDEKGSLWNSIAVKPRMARSGGHADVEAYSNNYYSGFVNDGFDHGLIPILRFQKGDNLMKRKWRLYATIPVSQLGQGYSTWSVYKNMGGGDSNDDLTAGFSYFGDQLSPGAGVVDFADRTGDAKHQEGVHMFEKGFTAWLNRAVPRWKNDVDKIVRQNWGEGKAFTTSVRGPQLRNVAGSAGGVGGRYAKRSTP